MQIFALPKASNYYMNYNEKLLTYRFNCFLKRDSFSQQLILSYAGYPLSFIGDRIVTRADKNCAVCDDTQFFRVKDNPIKFYYFWQVTFKSCQVQRLFCNFYRKPTRQFGQRIVNEQTTVVFGSQGLRDDSSFEA